MKKLTKVQIKLKDELSADIQTKLEELNQEIEAYNEKVEELFGAVESAAAEFEQALCDARDFRDDIVNTIDEYASERSEKWPETETGERVMAWKDAWEALELDFDGIEKPEPLERCDFNEAVLDDMDTEA